MIKAALSPTLGPLPFSFPPYNVASRGTLWAHWPNIVRWGGGKERWNCQKRPSVPLLLTRIVSIARLNSSQMSITSRGFYVFEPNLDRKFLQAPYMYCWCIYGKRRILACILQHNNEVSRGKFRKMFDNRTKIEQITVKTCFIRHRSCRESTITSKLICSLSACFCFWWIHETGNLQLQKSAAGTGR